jgi:hypothetical protein
MNAFRGMDAAQLREHAERLRTASGEVEALTARLGTTVHSATWTGADADAFRARWASLATGRLAVLCTDLLALGVTGLEEAAEQEAASARDGGAAAGDGRGPTGHGSTSAGADGAPSPTAGSVPGGGYLHEDGPWLPDRFEDPLESALSGLAERVSAGIGWGVDTGIDLLEHALGTVGANTDGIAQFRRDADHVGGILEDWATGERVPTIAEIGAAGLLALGSAGVGVLEAATGRDTALLDDRRGGIVESVTTDDSPAQGPQTLQDLVLDNTALRSRAPGGGPLENGRIGIQEVRSTHSSAPSYIVQVPPTEGARISELPGAYGEQGNSRDWGSNLRLVAGQHPAAMDDVRAAMETAGVPPGADVMIVGHSQGGIIANRLAADPTFNSRSGEPGSYNVTHAFTVGSPVQTVVPAQATTESVNVSHEASLGPGGLGGDLIPATDLQGLQVDGGMLAAPNRHEVTLEAYPGTSWDPMPVLAANHDSVGPDGDPAGGYAGSVGRASDTDPTLSVLQDDLTGVYLGEGTYVARSQVVTVGRGPA